MRTALRTAPMILALSVGLTVFWAADREREQKLQQAIDLMETKGDLNGAMRLFEEVAASPDRNLAARSVLYLGQCYEKLGKDGARKAYERIVRDFADQREVAAEARTRLAALRKLGAGEGPAGLIVRQVWAGSGVDVLGGLSPDGRHLTFVDWDTGDLAVRDLRTGKNRRLTNKGSWDDSSEFAEFSVVSPDGKQVAYNWFNKDESFDLRITKLDGSESRVVLRYDARDYAQPLGWTPDGKRIFVVFSKDQVRTLEAAFVSVADGSMEVIKTLPWFAGSWGSASLSPDGRYVVYDKLGEGFEQRDIFLLSTDGNSDSPLISHPADDRAPVWTCFPVTVREP